MVLRHVGLTCGSEDNADRFYKDLLGLEKSESKTLPASLSKSIFNIDSELVIINYLDQDVHFEIFIAAGSIRNPRQIEHLCLEVGDLNEFLNKCNILGVEVAQIPKGDKTLIFVKDFDGNLFEIKGTIRI
jgi:catechol 2,3-dioxygenase-like lactoylglutathione lyase family enzyme